MSVTINWRPIANENHFKGGTSSDLKALEETFGGRIYLENLNLLRAMLLASGNQFYQEVIDAVEKHEEIEFYGSY